MASASTCGCVNGGGIQSWQQKGIQGLQQKKKKQFLILVDNSDSIQSKYVLKHNQYHANEEMCLSVYRCLASFSFGWSGGKAGTVVMADVIFAIFPSAIKPKPFCRSDQANPV